MQPDGGVHCEADGECVSFNVKQLKEEAYKAKYIEPDYFDYEFGESKKIQEQSGDFWAFTSVIEMALVDYDKFNFVQKKYEQGVPLKDLRKFMPELASRDLEGVSPLASEYDYLDVEAFFNFCRKSPFDGQDRQSAYPFVALRNVNQIEMDEYIIGTWMKNHESMETYEKELNEISID